MRTLADALTDLIDQAARAADLLDPSVQLEACVPTGDARHGDYQSNYAFRVGKARRTNPRQVAQTLVDALPPSPLVAKVEVAGPGFVNLFLADEALAVDLLERSEHPTLGAPLEGQGRRLVIDYSSPNIAKRMHVGHLRSTVIGNALDRIHRFLGWEVVADNHVGDWGTQYGKLIVGWHGWRDDEAFAADPIGELQRIYQEFGARADADPALIEAARAETVKLQEGDPQNRELWERFVGVSMDEFDTIYERFGIHFDVTYGESHYRDALQPLVGRLLASGVAVEDDGAVIVPFEEEDGKGLKNSPLLVRKSDGAALYGTTDLATLELREEVWSPDRVMYVTDVRQKLHFQQVFAAARKTGIARESTELVHVWFGMLKFADGAVASTRQGQVVDLLHVLDTAVERARGVVDEKSGHLDATERASIAEAVGVGAVRYTDLSQNPQSDIVFDWDKMLAFEGNTAPYILYAHARCCSILRKAEEVGAVVGAVHIEDASERELALTLARTAEAILLAANTSRPNLVCDQLYRVASALAVFYGRCRVLDGTPEVVGSRLALVQATANTLRTAMPLVGLTPLERM